MGGKARQGPATCWTIGHSTLTTDRFVERLAAHEIRQLADVRRYPASRRYPRFNREILATTLEARGIAYRWHEGLGGRRKGLPMERSSNQGIENSGFRGYADYMQTPAFQEAFEALIMWMADGRTALMCAEALWWRCHRRLVSDLLVVRGREVAHILPDGALEPHRLWEIAVRTPTGLVYPPDQPELDLGAVP